MVLHHEGIDCADLSVTFVTRQRMRSLNKKYLRRDYGTDVLAFELENPVPIRNKAVRKGKMITGEIIISTDAVLQNARIYSTSLAREAVLYVVHGILHLLGYDDHKQGKIKKMRNKEQVLIDYLGAKINKCVF